MYNAVKDSMVISMCVILGLGNIHTCVWYSFSSVVQHIHTTCTLYWSNDYLIID